MKIERYIEYLNENKMYKNIHQFLNYIEKLSENKVFIFIDTETTGLGGHKKQQLTQIAAVGYEYNYKENKLKQFGEFNKKIKISDDIKYKLKDPNDRIYKVFKFNHYGDKIKNDPKYYNEQDVLKDFDSWLAHSGYYL